MDARTMTTEQIRQAGLKALANELGVAGMIRFLQQFETGQGDYPKDRHDWLERLDVKALVEKIHRQRREEQ